jgi:hypothetical protein
VPRLQVKGRPKVEENLDGRWAGRGKGSRAGKSGSRTKKGDKAAGGVADCRMAIGWGTVVVGREQSGEATEAEAGSGRQSGET